MLGVYASYQHTPQRVVNMPKEVNFHEMHRAV